MRLINSILRSIWFERLAPIALGITSLCIIIVYRNDVAQQFQPNGWKPENLYSAVFNWASIQSGFVFGIYGFIATKKDGFVGEIVGNHSFEILLGYARRAYLTGFSLTFASLPLLVISPSVSNVNTVSFWCVSVWFSCFIWTFCAFLRVAFIFGMIVAVPDRNKEIPG